MRYETANWRQSYYSVPDAFDVKMFILNKDRGQVLLKGNFNGVIIVNDFRFWENSDRDQVW